MPGEGWANIARQEEPLLPAKLAEKGPPGVGAKQGRASAGDCTVAGRPGMSEKKGGRAC